MKFKINTQFSSENKDIEVTISANKLTMEVQELIGILQDLDTYLSKIIATKNNDIFIVYVDDIICLYSEDKYNYCRTTNGVYRIKQTLYELENKLSPNDFIRISNSCIANFKHVECFNTDTIGSIKVKYKDGNTDYVSRRRIKNVMKVLKGGI